MTQDGVRIGEGEKRQQFLGLAFDPLTASAATGRVVSLAGRASFAYVVTPNVDHVIQLHRDFGQLSTCYTNAALCLCDSRILSRLAQWSGVELPVATGSDLTRDLLAGALPPATLAVVGGDAELHRSIAALFPRHDWIFHQPPMGVRHDPEARQAIVHFVEENAADLVFFAIGAPQSELLCAEISARGRARGVGLCVGASLEFLTGAKRRAPIWIQRSSLEWLYRLLSEPGRLWRRYLVDGPSIFAIWWRWHRRFNLRRRGLSGSSPSDAV